MPYTVLARRFHIYKSFFFTISTLYFLANGVFLKTNIIKLRRKRPSLLPRKFLHLTPNDTRKEMGVLFVSWSPCRLVCNNIIEHKFSYLQICCGYWELVVRVCVCLCNIQRRSDIICRSGDLPCIYLWSRCKDCEKRLLASQYLLVGPSALSNFFPAGRNFMKFCIGKGFTKICPENSSLVKIGQKLKAFDTKMVTVATSISIVAVR